VAVIGLVLALLLAAASPQGDAPDESKIRALIDQLGADFLEEREPARKALELAGKAAEPLLIQALSNPDHRVRRSCLELLLILKPVPALKRASELFGSDDDPTVRDAAFRLLQSLGKDAEDALIGALSSPQPEYRLGAIVTLTGIPSQKGVPKVAELYDRETVRGVKDAAWKCLLSAGKPAEPFLLKYLQDQDAEIRKGALAGLKGSQDEQTLDAVKKLFLQEADEGPLSQAYDFLQRAGPKAEDAFLEGLKSAREPTRLRSIQGLRGVKSDKALAAVGDLFLGDCPVQVRSTAADYLKGQGLRAEALLLGGLDAKEPAVRLLSIQMLGEIGSEKALPRVSRLFREEKTEDIHKRCFEFLKRPGLRAEDDLLHALGDEDIEIRRQAVVALGEAQSVRAIPRLIEFMTELNPVIKEASEAALASIGAPALEEVVKAVAAGRLRKAVAEGIEAIYTRGEVERILESQLGDDVSTGFYDGQFKDLEAFGRQKAVPVLIQMLNDKKYVFRRAQRSAKPDRYPNSMKELAVMALGELGGDGALPALQAFAADNIQMQSSTRIHEETLVALHRHGDPKPLEEYLKDVRRNADRLLKSEAVEFKEDGIDLLFSLGLLLTRLKQYPQAIQVYEELMAEVEKHKLENARKKNFYSAYYNLACLYALTGDRARSVDWLEKAVKAGFTDRAWIRKDGDLDAIREEPGYKKLLADDRLFEKKPDDALPADK
jgi:HEAT repeat protein